MNLYEQATALQERIDKIDSLQWSFDFLEGQMRQVKERNENEGAAKLRRIDPPEATMLDLANEQWDVRQEKNAHWQELHRECESFLKAAGSGLAGLPDSCRLAVSKLMGALRTDLTRLDASRDGTLKRLATDAANELRAYQPSERSAAALAIPQSDEYVSVSTVYPDKFTSYKLFQSWLKKHPEIRTQKPSANRLEIHAADWLEYWKKAEAPGSHEVDDLLPEHEARRNTIKKDPNRPSRNLGS